MNEEDNIYVSSRGILKSCDYYSLKPISSIRYIYNYPNIDTIKDIKNPVIYVCGSSILDFINTLLPLINKQFILVSGDCDETMPYDILNKNILNTLLNDNRLIHWFSQNMVLNHNKITKMPIGLDYHTLTLRAVWGPIASCKQQELILTSLMSKSKFFWERTIKCYGNFHFTMNTKLGYDRKDAYNKINKNLIYYEPSQVNRIITWNNQINYSFVICPHGGGLDCHRNWEALILGCIPIVKTSKIDDLYKDLPVLIVNEWSDINEHLLSKTIDNFKIKYNNKEFNMEKLKLKYWIDLINNYK